MYMYMYMYTPTRNHMRPGEKLGSEVEKRQLCEV